MAATVPPAVFSSGPHSMSGSGAVTAVEPTSLCGAWEVRGGEGGGREGGRVYWNGGSVAGTAGR